MTKEQTWENLPYGMWTCADGREVLFNRRYKPLMARMPGQQATEADRNEWVAFVQQRWLYNDGNVPRRDKATMARCKDVLAAFARGDADL